MDGARAWRIATGAMLLAAGASRLLPPATNYFLLAFGGALFGASLAAPSGVTAQPRQTAPEPAAVTPQALYVPPMRSRKAHGALVAASMTIGAGLLIVYPWLTHTNSPRLQATRGGARPQNTVGRAVPPTSDPQLHVVGLGERFILSRAQIAIGAASVCKAGTEAQVDVPAVIHSLRSGVSIAEPEYQLLDSRGIPHLPAQTVSLQRPPANGGHAVPPPSAYHESINFKVPIASARGSLKLQAVLPTGSGPEYRVTVAGQNSRRSSSAEDLPAACISPGGQGV